MRIPLDGASLDTMTYAGDLGTSPTRLLLLGPQGAGKGTQAQRLAAFTGARHISTGDLIRAEIAAGTRLGRTIKGYNDRGELVPDATVIDMVRPILSEDNWLLDGFPRTLAQAIALDRALGDLGAGLDLVVALEAPDAALIERLSGRRQSEATGKIYHLVSNPPGPDDPGPFIQRDDDRPEHIRRRLELYHAETEPLKEYYAARGLLAHVDALQPIEQVTARILWQMEAHMPARKAAPRAPWAPQPIPLRDEEWRDAVPSAS